MKKKIILAVNAGSSSVKVSVYTAQLGEAPIQIAEGSLSGLTAPPPTLDYTRRGKKVTKDGGVRDKADTQRDAFDVLIKTFLEDADLPELTSKSDIGIICHRIVHGGDFARPQLISDGTYAALERLNDLAPLHNANSLGIVHQCVDEYSGSSGAGAKNVACFDSQFHASIPEHIRTYPINQDIARSNHLRKYGFHGLSYSFITRATAEFLGKKTEDLNIIALHLGSGASVCAIKGGKSWDTSMGLTPLAGLPGATRSGSVDPSLVFHYASDVGKLSPSSTASLHISRAEEILNKESGWKALTGTTNFGTIAANPDGEPAMDLAFDLFVDRVCGFIGSYFVTLGGEVDALVFAGGIGEKSERLRGEVGKRVECLGFGGVDEGRNRDAGGVGGVVVDVDGADGAEGVGGRKRRVLVCRTDEQFEMARSCAEDEEFW